MKHYSRTISKGNIQIRDSIWEAMDRKLVIRRKKVAGVNVVGKRHSVSAEMLFTIEVGSRFTTSKKLEYNEIRPALTWFRQIASLGRNVRKREQNATT